MDSVLGELTLPEPYIYEKESISELVEYLAPVLQDLSLTIVSIRPATDDEVYNYLRGDVADDDDDDPEWDEYFAEAEDFWEELIAEAEGQ
jgi:hypothetical protein